MTERSRFSDDSYGSALRESMKRSMSEPSWHPLNRVEKKDPIDQSMDRASKVLGILSVIFISATIIAQIAIKAGWIR